MNNITTPTIDIIRFLIDNPDVAKINFCKQSDFLKNQERFNNSVEL
jgi:hypothetical protein